MVAYPAGLDNFANPTAADTLSTPAVLHSTQHANANDAIEALEALLGVTGAYKFLQIDAATQAATSLAISGLTGAANASRYVGATAGGKPTAGTFAVGDYIIDRAGYIWICTAAGTPGTWVSPAGGVLPGGYAQVTAGQTGITTETDLTGLSVTVTVGTNRRLKITGYLQGAYRTVADGTTYLRAKEGATVLNVAQAQFKLANEGQTMIARAVVTPTAGNHTYKLSLAQVSGTGTSNQASSVDAPSSILVEDIGGT